MSTARIFGRNLSANWVGFGANVAVAFCLSPFVIHTLGEAVYGIWSLLMVLMGYLGIADIGVRASTGRYVVLYLGRHDHRRLDETIRTSLTIFSILGIVFLLLGLVVGLGFPYFFPSTPEKYQRAAALIMPALAVNVWFMFLGVVFSSILTAHDRFDLARGVDLGVLIVRATGTVLALKGGYGIVGLTIVTLICGLLAFLANFVLARRIYAGLRVWPLKLVRTRLRELFGFGIWAAISTTATRIMGRTDLILVGILIGVSRVTVYSVAAMLVYYFSNIVELAADTFFPPIQRAAARGDMESVRWYYLYQVRLTLALGMPMYLGYIIFGNLFIALWMGHPVEFPPSSVTAAASVMVVLSTARLIALPGLGGVNVLISVGRVRFTSVAAGIEALINVGLSIFFVAVMHWGVVGVAAGTLVACGLVNAWVIPWQAAREAGLQATTFLKVVASGVAAGGGFCLWSMLLRTLIAQESWLAFWSQVTLALVGYAPMAFFLLVPAPDRKRMLEWFQRPVRTEQHEAEAADSSRSHLP